jgi:plasmid maintenance system antidote protein VapI
MSSETLTSQESYNPNRLLDHLIERLHLKNDAALSRALEVAPPVISKIRHRRLPVGASMLIRMHEVSSLSVRELRDLMGDRRTKYRLSDAQGKPKPSMEGDLQGQSPQGSQSPQQPQGGHTHTPHHQS